MTDSDAIAHFLATPLDAHLREVLTPDDAAWKRVVVEQAARTPAYLDFLRTRGVSAEGALGLAEPTTKPNYIHRYPLAARCLGGALYRADFMAVSSGTTGKATIWPRTLADEIRTSFALEQIFVESFETDRKRTLVLVCFPLGIWIGGMYTASAARMLSRKGHQVTVLTPGVNLAEICRCLQEVAPLFEQTIMCGYPPAIRDFIDALTPAEIDPAVVRMKLLLAGEAVSESWRDDMSAKLAIDPAECGIVSMYGTADAGIVGFETARTVEARRILSGAEGLRQSAFGNPGLPSLFQYQPHGLRIEDEESLVLLTMTGLHPHFRYSLGDAGTGISYGELKSRVPGLSGEQELPLVALFGRTDHTVSFFGGNIYPEHVAELLDRTEFRTQITGRFTMLVEHSASENSPLRVVVELQPGVDSAEDLSGRLAEALEAHLLATNSEYANYVPRRYQRPLIEFRAHRDEELFARGKKQVYVRSDPDLRG